MSGLGTTIEPAGTPGSIVSNVPLQTEVAPDAPQQIAQTTAIQTLDQLLHQNWIYDSTFTVSTAMPAGTVIYTKPIHPSQWNWPNRIVSRMFNAWTGSGKIRYRPLATAWYGGSIRVGFLPPNIKQSEINSLPLEILTSYPIKDIDPKNTSWVDFRGPDQREIAYHYMSEFNPDDRQNFGGYIVFYVAGKLVTQSADFTTIQFVVETAGDFMYDQPGPKALDENANATDPLGLSVNYPISEHPLIDSHDSGFSNGITVCDNSINAITAGSLTMAAVGLKNPMNVLPSVKCDPLYNAFTIAESSSCYGWAIDAGSSTITSPQVPHIGRQLDSPAIALGAFNIVAPDIPTDVKFKAVYPTKMMPNSTNTALYLAYGEGEPTDLKGELAGSKWADLNTSPMMFSTMADTPIVPNTISGSNIKPLASGESIVLFTNAQTRSYAVQTRLIRQALIDWPNDDSNSQISWLYNIVNDAGTPLALIRLNPNGVFTTNATTAPIIYPGTCKLRYFGTLSINTPLPPMSLTARQYRVSSTRVMREKLPCLQACQQLVNEASLF